MNGRISKAYAFHWIQNVIRKVSCKGESFDLSLGPPNVNVKMMNFEDLINHTPCPW